MSDDRPEAALVAGFPPATREAWMALVAKVLKGADFERRLVARTADGIPIAPLYTRADQLSGAEGRALEDALPSPADAARRAAEGWDIRQFHSEDDPGQANAAILEDLEGGATSIALHVASPGGSGLSADRDSLAVALRGVRLEACSVALVAGERAPEAADALAALWAEQGIAEGTRRGHFNADPLGTLAQTGALGRSLDESLARAARLARSVAGAPGVTAMVADGNPYHAAGASEAQELAAMLATLVAYLRAAEQDGLTPDLALPRVAIALAIDDDLFLSAAKLRAAHRLVHRVAEACNAGAGAARVHATAVSAWRMLSRRDPWTNIMRTTISCAGAAIGGAHSVMVLPFTYALGRPDPLARRIARNIQIICQEEAHLGRVIDPARGSWYVDRLTSDLSGRAWDLFQVIEARGGMAASIVSGFVQDEIATTAERRQRDLATGRIELTGVSAFPLLDEDGISALPWPQALPPVAEPAIRARRLEQVRLAEPFERLRDAADAHTARSGRRPRVFLACLGVLADYGQRATWVRNFLASGGIELSLAEGLATPDAAAAAFAASETRAVCLVSSDAIYDELGAATAASLRSAGAGRVVIAGKPGAREETLRAAGVDGFWHAGMDRLAALTALHGQLGVAGSAGAGAGA